MSDRIVVMSDGQIEQVGTPEEIYRRPTSLFVADFIGKANVFRTRVIDRSDGGIRVELFGATVAVEDPGVEGELITTVLRPEDVAVRPHPSPNDHESAVVDGAIEVAGWLRGVEYLGATTHLTIELLDGTLLAAVRHHTASSGPQELPPEGSGVVAAITVDAVRAVRSGQ